MTRLPAKPEVSQVWRSRLERLGEATRANPPPDLAAIVRAELGIDLTARYARISIPHPFGKASGQLSCTLSQIEADVRAGIAFVVLKTVIAESASGERAMDEWAIPETKMRVERRAAPDGRVGWTVTWTGRGWAGSLEEYVEFFRQSLSAARVRDIPVVPSVKYHLPTRNEDFRDDEYRYTTKRLLELWDRAGCGGPMVLEKDFSPTLAGDDRAQRREQVLRWLETVPGLIARAGAGRVRLGVKVMNALFDDAFQLDMVHTLCERADPTPAFLVVFNRLFDSARAVAFGGWELSDRNLRVLDVLRESGRCVPPLSATGNVCSGRMMLEYALRGCENGQLHTFFQLPLSAYTATGGTRTGRALHTLMLHPTDGITVWLRHLHEAGTLDMREGILHFLDLVEAMRPQYPTNFEAVRESADAPPDDSPVRRHGGEGQAEARP